MLRSLGAAALALSTLVALPTTAHAISVEEGLVDNLVVSVSDERSIGRCALTVKSVNYAAGTVRVQLYEQVRPLDADAAFDVAHVGATCAVTDVPTAVLTLEADGPIVRGAETFTLPLMDDYEICLAMTTTTRSGDTTTVGPACAS
jgi:hypothetical protein